MSKIVVLVLLLGWAGSVAGQEEGRVEVFGGYSFTNENFTGALRSNAHGWNASVAYSLKGRLGVVADFGGLYGASTSLSMPPLCPLGQPCLPTIVVRTEGKTHTFLFGPRVSFAAGKGSVFVHALLGGVQLNSTTTFEGLPAPLPGAPAWPYPLQFSSAGFGFGAALGGGVDFTLKGRLGWRVQADYVHSGLGGGTQNNFRMSTGPVFHFH